MLKFLLVVALFALVVYLLVRRMQGPTGGSILPRNDRPPNDRRPVAPDDDEQFLRDLERRRKHDEGT